MTIAVIRMAFLVIKQSPMIIIRMMAMKTLQLKRKILNFLKDGSRYTTSEFHLFTLKFYISKKMINHHKQKLHNLMYVI